MAEILDIVDENGNSTGKTVERETAHAKGIRHRTSHVWLVRIWNGRWQILLQKRSSNKDSFPGCWDISSAGHIPAGSGFEESALRELQEELGVNAAREELIYCGTRRVVTDCEFHGRPFHDRQVSRVFILLTDRNEEEFVLQEEEISQVRWMNFDECRAAVREHSIPSCIDLDELDMIYPVLKQIYAGESSGNRIRFVENEN